MNALGNINRFLDAKSTAVTVFGVTGLCKLASDYKNAPDDKKQYILAHDGLVLGASGLGVVAYNVASKKLVNTKTLSKFINRTKSKVAHTLQKNNYTKPIKVALKHGYEIITNCLNNALMLGTGILGAIGADYATHAVKLDKRLNKKQVNSAETQSFDAIYNTQNKIVDKFKNSSINQNLEQAVGTEVKKGMYSRIFDFPAMKMFSSSMVGMQGFEVIQEKTFKARMKHATKCLVANSLVPVFFLSTASSVTKKMNTALRLPIIFATMIFGTMYTNKFIDKQQYKYSKNTKKPKREITKVQTTT